MSIEKFTVSRDDAHYQAWPDVVLTDSGKLICTFAECTHHINRDGARIMLCESVDRGRTWSQKRPLTDAGEKGNFYNCARISKLSDGSLVIVCDKITGDKTKGIEEDISSEVHMWLGDAEGTHFNGPFVTPARGIVPDKLLELENGRWLLGAHFKSEKTGKLEQYVWYSDDKGKTWSDRITVGADERYNLCEVSILPLSNGTLVAFMRENSAMGRDCMKSFSYDNGETWDGVYNMPIPACHRPVAGILNDASVMITHRYMQGGGCEKDIVPFTPSLCMHNIFAAFLCEDSLLEKERSKQWARIMPLDYDRSINADTGYTGWVQFDDEEIYVVNYIVDDAKNAQIRGYSFRMEDVIIY